MPGVLRRPDTVQEGAGEAVTARSPLIRDAWDNNKHRKNRAKDTKDARPVSPKAIANMMGELLKKTHLRDPDSRMPAGGRHYKFKQVHGLRKYFKTNAERAIKIIDVEKLIGHAESYYKPSVEYLLGQYERIVLSLTISEADELKDRMQKQAAVSDRTMGEIERENVALQDRLNRLESSYDSLKEILEDVILEKTRGGNERIRVAAFGRSPPRLPGRGGNGPRKGRMRPPGCQAGSHAVRGRPERARITRFIPPPCGAAARPAGRSCPCRRPRRAPASPQNSP